MRAPPSQGLWTCAVGTRAPTVFLAHKDATTVCPPPQFDPWSDSGRANDKDLDTTAGLYSAGAQTDPAAAIFPSARKCIGGLIKEEATSVAVFNVEATDGLPSVVYESVGQSVVHHRSSLRIT